VNLKLLLVPILAVALAMVVAVPVATAKAPAPTAGTKVVGGLLSPRGMKIGPDGMLYVAEAGSGGATVVTVEGSDSHSGLTGRISKIDPSTGARTTVADKLPSNAGAEGDAVGPADVAFIGNQLYYVQTHGGTAYGFPSNPTGIYKVNSNGTVTLLADVGKFNEANLVTPLKDKTQQDIEPGGNPYSMTVRDGAFYVVDGNQNQVMKVTSAGAISRLVDFPTHIVSTGITYSGTGPFFVGGLGTFPFAAADGAVYQVGNPSGAISKVASGYSSVTDVEFGPGGTLYALTFGDAATDPNAPAPWDFGSGKILKVNTSTGTMTPVVDGFTFTTGLIFSGDTAYIANNGVSIPGLLDGEIWRIPNFSSLAPLPVASPTPVPPAATPTAAGTSGVITAPNTGTGGASDASSSNWLEMLLGLGIGAGALVLIGTRALWKRSV